MALHVHFVIELLFVERDIVRVISHTHARMETNAPPERIKNLRYVSTGLEKVHFLVISNFGLSPDPFFPEKNYQNYQLLLFPRRDLPATFPRSFLMPWTSHNFLHNLRTNSSAAALLFTPVSIEYRSPSFTVPLWFFRIHHLLSYIIFIVTKYLVSPPRRNIIINRN